MVPVGGDVIKGVSWANKPGERLSYRGSGVCPHCEQKTLAIIAKSSVDSNRNDRWDVDIECIACGAGTVDIVSVEGTPMIAVTQVLEERLCDPETKRAAWVAEALMDTDKPLPDWTWHTKRQIWEGKHGEKLRECYRSAVSGQNPD